MSAKNSVEFLKDTQQQLKAYGVPEGIASLIIVQCMNAALSQAHLHLEKN